MKTNLLETTGTCRLEIRPSERDSFTEYHLTATLTEPRGVEAAADELFGQVAAAVARLGIQPISEKLYGLTTARERVLKRRDATYRLRGLERTMPVTWVQGGPLLGCDFAGLQLWGVVPADGEKHVRTVESRATGRAREWRGDGFRMLHLACVRGTGADGGLAEGAVAQASQMFANLGEGLSAQGMRYTDLVRTWIYSARLLDWYDDLNRVRTPLYRREGLGVEGGPAFPASTGIMGRCDSEECMMDALALESSGTHAASACAIRCSPRQDSSFNYGSAFSRGMAIEIEERRTVHVSGTASINREGKSTHVGDAEHQSLDTLMSIAAILEEQGGGLKDITSATLFCKNRDAWEAWESAARRLSIPAIPKVCVQADVCRHDLLVEMEAVAVI